jgi:hypothetical protein
VGVPDVLLVEVPWASGVWGLPFLSVLAPSERYAEERGKKRHKKITDYRARQMLLLVRRWYPEREIVAVADRGYAALSLLSLLHRCVVRSPKKPITFISRACAWTLCALRAGPATQTASQMGRPGLKGRRRPRRPWRSSPPSRAPPGRPSR